MDALGAYVLIAMIFAMIPFVLLIVAVCLKIAIWGMIFQGIKAFVKFANEDSHDEYHGYRKRSKLMRFFNKGFGN